MAVSSLRDRTPPAHDRLVTVGFAGLTHSGIVAALTAAARGARVVAFDSDMALVARLKRGELPVVAPALIQRAMTRRSRLDYTATAADFSQCDVICICADVPANEKGRSDLTAVQALLDEAAAAARSDAVLVILSPVPAGFSRAQARKDRAIYYQLEPLAFDEAPDHAADPERFVVGCADPAAPLPAAYRQFLELFDCPILPMRYESAELTRCSRSLLRVAGDDATQTIVDLCEKSGGDWSEMASVLARGQGIAPAGAVPGFGVERDLATLLRLAETHSLDASVIETALADIRRQRNWVLQRLEEAVLAKLPDARLAILGLASWPGTTSTTDSPALALLASLPKLRIRAFDPAVVADPAWHAQIETTSDALEACRQTDAVVIMTPWREFAALDPAALAACMRGRVVIDPYRLLDTGAVNQAGLAHHVPD